MLIAGELAVKLGLDDSRFQAGMTSAHQKFQNLGKNLTQAGGILSASLTLPLTLLGKEIFDVGVAYEKAMNVFKATTGASAEVMARAGQIAKELGADLKLPATSAGDAALAMTELAKGGLSAQQAMDAARGTLQLAAAAQIDEARAAEIAANALNAFKLEASEAGRVADLLASAANASSAEINDIALSMQQSAASASALKIPIDDLITAIGLMANAGIKGSDAGTSLKTMMNALTPSTDKAVAAMNQLGINAFDAQGKFIGLEAVIAQAQPALQRMTDQERAFAIETAFGSDAMRAANILLGSGTEAFIKMDEAMNRAGASMELASAKTQGLGGALDGIRSQLETIALSIFQAVAPGIEKVARFFGELFTKIGEINPALLQSGVAFAAVLAVAGPVALAIGGIVTAIGAIGAPLAAAIAAVGAFAAAYAGNWAGLRDKVNALVTELSEFYLRHKDTIDAAVQGIVAIIKFLAERWAENIAQMIDGIRLFLKVIEGDWQGAWNLYKEIATKKSEETNASVMATLTALGDRVKEIWNRILESTKEVWNQLPELIGRTAGQIVKAIIDMGVKIMVTFVDLKQKIVAWFLQLVPEGVRGATNFREAVIAGIQSLPQMMLNVMLQAVRFLANLPAEFFKVGRSIGSRLWEGFKEGMGIRSPSFIEKALDQVVKVVDALPSHFAGAGGKIVQSLKDWVHFASTVIKIISDLGVQVPKILTDIGGAATQTASSIGSAISGVFGALTQAVSTFASTFHDESKAVRFAGGFLLGGPIGGILSAIFGGPTAHEKEMKRQAEEKGRLEIEGLKESLKQALEDTKQAIVETAAKTRDLLSSLASFGEVPKEIINRFVKNMVQILNRLVDAATKFKPEALEAAKKWGEAMGPAVDVMAKVPLVMEGINRHMPVAESQIDRYFIDWERIVIRLGALAESTTKKMEKQIKQFSERVGPSADLLNNTVTLLVAMLDLEPIPDEKFGILEASIEKIIASIGRLKDKFDRFWIKQLQAFAESAVTGLAFWREGVDAVKATVDVEPVSDAAIENVLSGIERFIQGLVNRIGSMATDQLPKVAAISAAIIPAAAAIKAATEAFAALRDYKEIAPMVMEALVSDFEQALRTLNELMTMALQFEEQAIAFKDAITRGSDALRAGLDTFVSGILDTRAAIGSVFGGRDQATSILSAPRSQAVIRQGDTSTQFVITIQGQPNPKIQAAIDALVELAGPAGIGRMATQG